MKTEWDYSDLAKAYLKRPDYSDQAIEQMLEIFGVGKGSSACDIGAGVAHLTLMLGKRGLKVTAIEPNDNMRHFGMERCKPYPNITYVENTAEHTGQADHVFDCVTFGSSFNVTDRAATLKETDRILKSRGWFAAMWNHRDLGDPIQAEIESIIHRLVPAYAYGTRREDQTQAINDSGLFGSVRIIEGPVLHNQPIADVVEAWRSHATLQRQAKEAFPRVVERIAQFLQSLARDSIQIPYTTRIWLAQRTR
jgi:ubiquinone/menaquinone biosynthesis C-methylase UbiE